MVGVLETHPTQTRSALVLAGLAIVTLVSLWVANQGGLAPSHPAAIVLNMLIVLESLPHLAAIWLAAAGFGFVVSNLLFPRPIHASVVQLGLGMALLLILSYLLAWVGYFDSSTAWWLLGGGMMLLAVQLASYFSKRDVELHLPSIPASAVLLGLPLGVLLVAAVCPPSTLWSVEAFGYDVTSYHLQVPREWLARGRMVGLEHNVYSYQPNLMYVAYMLAACLKGSMYEAIYLCQLLHASLAVLAALAIGSCVSWYGGSRSGAAAAAIFLVTPWVIITGSLAYDEMAAVAMAAVAVRIVVAPVGRRLPGAFAIGLLGGVATLCKLTAGPMLALPLVMLVLLRFRTAATGRSALPGLRRAMACTAVAACATALVLIPYFVRNGLWTGNPVFPFATEIFGTGHWTAEQVARWTQAHGPGDAPWQERLGALDRQWLRNAGYGALGGTMVERTATDIARFDREGGLPLLLIAALLAASLATATDLRARRIATGMLVFLGVQLLFWLLGTHLQSRFLTFTVLPLTLLIGLGLGRMEAMFPQRLRPHSSAVASVLVIVLWAHLLHVLWTQTPLARDDRGNVFPVVPAMCVGSLQPLSQTRGADVGAVGTHPLNILPPESRVYMVADASNLLYIRSHFTYHTAWDKSELGALLRQSQHAAPRVTAALRQKGYSYVWVHWSELRRLHASYGYDPDVTEASMRWLVQEGHWRVTEEFGNPAAPAATLYALP